MYVRIGQYLAEINLESEGKKKTSKYWEKHILSCPNKVSA